MEAPDGPFHVSRSSDGKEHWFSARDAASGVSIPAKSKTDARLLVRSINMACTLFAGRQQETVAASEEAASQAKSEIEYSTADSRIYEDGLEIKLFIPTHGDTITGRFVTQGDFDYNCKSPPDPRPYLERAIETLKAELADVDLCPIHAPAGPVPAEGAP